MKANTNKMPLSFQAKDKNLRIPIFAKDNVTQTGETCFNPDDARILKVVIDAYNKIMEASKQPREKIDIESLEGKAIEDQETAEKIWEITIKAGKNYQIEEDVWNSVCNDLDSVLGEGVCFAFTGGQVDAELLEPLFNGIVPILKKARAGTANKYKK